MSYRRVLIVLFSLGVFACVPEKKKATLPKFTWKTAGHLPERNDSIAMGLAGPVTGISKDRLIFGGGSNFPDAPPWDGGHKTYYNTLYFYKKDHDSILPLKKKAKLPYKVAYSANAQTKNGMILVGGENERGALDQVTYLAWDEENENVQIDTLPDLPEALTAGAAVNIVDKLYFVGGQNGGQVSDRLYLLRLDALEKGWKKQKELPYPVTHAVLYGQENEGTDELYIVGGRKQNTDAPSTLYNKVSKYNAAKDEWGSKKALPHTLAAHTGIQWDKHRLLVFSGDRGETFHQTEELLFQVNRTSDSLQKEKLIQQKDQLQKTHPGFENEVWAYDLETDQWTAIDTIPFAGQVTTTALKWGEDVVIPGGEIRAGVRTPVITKGKAKH